eukprot:TRINITY_DN3283_c0_g1_i1.p1 TRINITY_DN3283_c0_g1~~TRINITY_DN3283_c0_g1_i1.p1  ORF type:complete len:330 (-),score=-1.07 TRINITY_DN3283_c0_g1_i1:24-1013(-)
MKIRCCNFDATSMSEIDKIEAPSSKEILHYVENNQPVIITNAISNWNALKSWNIPYLKSKSSPEKLVSVYNQPIRGAFPDPPYEMKFHDYLDYWQQPADDSIEDIFLGNLEVNSLSTDLVEDITPLPPLAEDKSNIERGRIWIGRPEHYSHLHYDAHDGLLCCVSGVKEVWLYAPLPHMKSIKQMTNGKNAALVNPLNVDSDRFPEFAQATPIKCKIEKGEILLIPQYWWHFVISRGHTIAVNFWIYPNIQAARLKFTTLWPITTRLLVYWYNKIMQDLNINKWKLLLPDNVLILYKKLLYPVSGEGEEWDQFKISALDLIRAYIVDNL